ncbi:MAG: formylglycine-generating enzyme family protein, partial [Treponema sp.]|nr:formylglycine-generating enzyme family protein [Treponema sp.]
GVSYDPNANGYRLPTEAEWLAAADDGHTYSGSDDIDAVAWYDGNSGSRTHEVKGKQANSAGIYDMSGNVWEWCWDIYSGTLRVIRGGSWDRDASRCAVSYPDYGTPDYRYSHGGFRVVRKAN